MYLSLVALSALLVFTCNAQEACNLDFVAYHDCMKTVLQSTMPSSEEVDQHKSEILTCFTASDCKEPRLHLDTDIAPMDGEAQEKAHKVMHCVHEASKLLADKVQECTAAKIPGFDLNIYKQTENAEPPETSAGDPIMHLKDAIENPSVCPPDAKPKVKECLKQHAESKKDKFDKKRHSFCNGQNECFTKMSADCQNTFKETSQVVQDCMCQGGASVEDFKPAYVQCMGEMSDEQLEVAHRLLERLHQRKCQESRNWSSMCQVD